MERDNRNKAKLLMAIVDKNAGAQVLGICRKMGFPHGMVLDGRGTANKEILRMLGIERIERDVAICLADEDHAQELLLLCNEEIGFYTPGNGIAFTVSPENVDPSLIAAISAF